MNWQHCSPVSALNFWQASVLEHTVKLSHEGSLMVGIIYFSFLCVGLFCHNTEVSCHFGFLACFQVLVFKLLSCFVQKKKKKRNNEPLNSYASCLFWKWRQKNVQSQINLFSVVCILFECSRLVLLVVVVQEHGKEGIVLKLLLHH